MKTTQQLITRERTIRLSFALLIFAICVFTLIAVDNLLISFVLAFTSSYLLTPIVRRLERRGLSRNMATIIPVLGLLVIISLSGFIFIPLIIDQILSFKEELPKYVEGLSQLISRWEGQITSVFPYVYKNNFSEKIGALGESTVTSVLQKTPAIARQLFTVSLLSPIIAFFMLKDSRNIWRSFLSLMPNNIYEMSLALSSQINKQLGEFVRARIVEALIVGIVVWIGLFLLGFPYALFLALFAALMNLIPYVGPFIGAAPAFVIAIINQQPSVDVLLMSMVYFIAQLIDIIFIIPLLVAKTVNLHPVTVIIVFIIGADLMGVLGMIISVPVASVLKLILNSVYDQLIKFKA